MILKFPQFFFDGVLVNSGVKVGFLVCNAGPCVCFDAFFNVFGI